MQTGALIIAILLVIGAIASMIDSAVNGAYGTGIVGLLLSGAIAVLLLIGILKEIPVLMIPAMVIMLIQAVLAVALGLAFIIGTAVGSTWLFDYYGDDPDMSDDSVKAKITTALSVSGVSMFVAAGIDVWFFTVVFACYRYLRDLRVSRTQLPQYQVSYPVGQTNQQGGVIITPQYNWQAPPQQQQQQFNVPQMQPAYPSPIGFDAEKKA